LHIPSLIITRAVLPAVSVPGPSSGAHENLRSEFVHPFRVARVLWPLGIQPEEERRFAARGWVLGCLVARMLGFVPPFYCC
jgi:hypothetical protein